MSTVPASASSLASSTSASAALAGSTTMGLSLVTNSDSVIKIRELLPVSCKAASEAGTVK
jgi:hypothetical protein